MAEKPEDLVTVGVVLAAVRAACDRSSVWKGATDAEVMGVFGANMQAALRAVAPLIRRAALEEAAAWHTQGALLAEREAENTTTPERRSELLLHARREQKAAAAILALAEKQP